jgi:hypothetical protein
MVGAHSEMGPQAAERRKVQADVERFKRFMYEKVPGAFPSLHWGGLRVPSGAKRRGWLVCREGSCRVRTTALQGHRRLERVSVSSRGDALPWSS